MKQSLRPIMFVGTGSDVGKSIINAGFCRIFKQDGYSPAPFKAQNMSLNSFAGIDGLELGRAQAVQAEACGIEPCSEMNPILLKPTSHQNAQVVLNGKPIGNQSAKAYFLGTDRDALFAEAMKAYHKLESQYNPMVIEGAGSISEINLREKDITNMRVGLAVNAAVILVADIDRGGVFGSVYGTLELLPPEERTLIKGILINKFRGDIDLFTEGRKMLEQLTGVPVVGVVPYFRDIHIDDEDSVVIDHKSGKTKDGLVNVAVVLLRRMSNFTDFNVLERIPEINLFYTANPEEIEKADVVVIPGSKNTMADLEHLRKTGLAKAILNSHEKGSAVFGICGGYQMMGREIHDPENVEGTVNSMPGLGLLPVVTTLTSEKRTVQSEFTFRDEPGICKGYEIHMGQTVVQEGVALAQLSDSTSDGCFLNEKTWGTYLHGIFDNWVVVQSILKSCGKETTMQEFNYPEYKNEQYNKLADHIRESCDLEYIYRVMKGIE
ncbi:MAG: cobyric acid synthase [Bacteroidota bacterium]|nr:cobyric acid synthase [Odoribacter sp.]MDP3643311.1 cobyric acid synthase [Bacteroidota bacterium]